MTNINPAPIRASISSKEGILSAPWTLWFQKLKVAIEAPILTLIQTIAPTPQANHATMWQASGSGTKDGQAYAQGDVLITSDINGTSKTALILDYSAL